MFKKYWVKNIINETKIKLKKWRLKYFLIFRKKEAYPIIGDD